MKMPKRSNCPVSFVLDSLGDKWSLLVLRDLILRGKKRYQELLSSEERIATNILAERLARLEAHQLISKFVDPYDKRQIIYVPTKKALDLLPVILEMARWGIKYNPRQGLTNPLLGKLKGDEKRLQREILSQFGY